MRWAFRAAPPLIAFWLLLSGHFSPLFVAFGAFSVALVCWISTRTAVADHGLVPLKLALRLPLYFLWLGKEVLVSSLAVLRRIWSPHPALRPAVGQADAYDMSVLSQVIYANSITLTPGTLSLMVNDDSIEVHGLEVADIEALRDGEMLRRTRRLEYGT